MPNLTVTANQKISLPKKKNNAKNMPNCQSQFFTAKRL